MTEDIVDKKQKKKKPLNDFELVRTLFLRTTERKLPYLLRNMGEEEGTFFLCSEKEEEFKYGSSDISIAILKIDDKDLLEKVNSVLSKLYGYTSDHQVMINIRDNISELSKTKGDTIEGDIETNDYGSSWITKSNKDGRGRTVFLSMGVESLFHFEYVKSWSDELTPILNDDLSDYVVHPFKYCEKETNSIVSIPQTKSGNSPIASLYPNGFRLMATKGIDVIMTSQLEDLGVTVVDSDLVVYIDSGMACRIAHRVVGEGWRMVIVRPWTIVVPIDSTPILNLGSREL